MKTSSSNSGCLGCQYLKQSCHGKGFRDFSCAQNPKRFAQIVSEVPLCFSKREKVIPEKDKDVFREEKMKQAKSMDTLEGLEEESTDDVTALYDIGEHIKTLYKRNLHGTPMITGDLKHIQQVLSIIVALVQERLEDGEH